MINRRKLAVSIFYNWYSSNDFIDHIFEEKLERNQVGTMDRAWLQSLLYGTIEHFFFLNQVLGKITKNRFRKNSDELKSIIILGSYEIIFMDSADYAVVNESVKIAKGRKLGYHTKIVNGILREMSRKQKELRKEYDESEDLKIKCNLNNDLIEILTAEFDQETIFNWLVEKKKVIWARKKILGISENNFFKVDNFRDIMEDLKTGLISIQDRSAGKLIENLDLKKNIRVLDYCSAPGGKACYIAERCEDELEIIATDISEERLLKVDQNIRRLSLKSIQTIRKTELTGKFNLVLVDIPCSGLGVIKKRIDLGVKCDYKRLKELAAIQAKIIEEASFYVEKGGDLALSTCTIIKEENEELIESFLNKNRNFELKKPFLKLLPFDGENDGAFLAVLKRIN